MAVLSLALGALYAALAFLIGPQTALARLSGAHRWTPEERAAFDGAAFASVWRRFHFGLAALHAAAAAVALTALADHPAAGTGFSIAIGVIPVFGYAVLVWAMRRWMPARERPVLAVAACVLGLTGAGVAVLLAAGARENQATADAQGVRISGMYGREFRWDELRSVTALPVDSLPPVHHRVHGFSDGVRRKGRFSTAGGGRVTLLLDGSEKALVRFVPVEGPPVFLGMPSHQAADSCVRAWERWKD